MNVLLFPLFCSLHFAILKLSDITSNASADALLVYEDIPTVNSGIQHTTKPEAERREVDKSKK
jgi:hypothetical protein